MMDKFMQKKRDEVAFEARAFQDNYRGKTFTCREVNDELQKASKKAFEAAAALYEERERKLVEIIGRFDCDCAFMERISGHRTGCCIPEIKEMMRELGLGNE